MIEVDQLVKRFGAVTAVDPAGRRTPDHPP
jgi:hypothetical protein